MRQATMPRMVFLIGLMITAAEGPASGQIVGDQVASRRVAHRPGALLPPGVVGREQLVRSPDSVGYIQPVELRLPDEATVSIADGGGFSNPHLGRLNVGLMVGSVYRFKVSQIPQNFAAEVYPSVEVVGRLRPPAGLENKFPIPIQITQRDLEHALAGRLVVRAVFLEDPQKAYPEQEDGNEQRTIMALDDEDPLRLADELGRPMAILRLGSRVPDPSGLDNSFLFGSPAVVYLTPTTDVGSIPVEVPTSSSPQLPTQAIEIAPQLEVVPFHSESVEGDRSTGAPDQPNIEKQNTAPDGKPVPDFVPDDPFLDDPAVIDDLPQP